MGPPPTDELTLDLGTPAPCRCAEWEGTASSHTASFPERQFETLAREDLGDYHGAIPHRGRLRCVLCGATFEYESSLMHTTVTREL